VASEKVDEKSMKFPSYVERQVQTQKVHKTTFLKELAKKSGVAFVTLMNLARGSKLVNYDKAKRLSEATDNKVSIKELCEKD
jgi:transcriptional regulator with XRE-family HTH domain